MYVLQLENKRKHFFNVLILFFDIEVNVLPLFTEIEKNDNNNCFSVCTPSDLDKTSSQHLQKKTIQNAI